MTMNFASVLSVVVVAIVVVLAAIAAADVAVAASVISIFKIKAKPFIQCVWGNLSSKLMGLCCTCIDCSMPLSNGLFEWTREFCGGIGGSCGADVDSKILPLFERFDCIN